MIVKIWVKSVFGAVVTVAIIFTSFYIFLALRGKSILSEQLGNLTHKKVSVGYIDLKAPLTLEIRQLDIEDFLKIDILRLSPSILGFLSGNIALNEISIIRPELTYERKASASPPAALPVEPAVSAVPLAAAAPSDLYEPGLIDSKKLPVRFFFKRINIKDGKINFIDYTVGPEGINITLKEINFKLNNIYVFPSLVTNFELRSKIPWRQGNAEGKIEAEGWIDIFKRNMQAKLRIQDIDGIYLYPYYSNWVDLEKARIERANLNFTSNISGLDNNVTADCHLELTDIVRKPLAPEESEEKAAKIANAVLDIFRALNQGKIVLNFTIRTKMDRPEFGFGSIKMAFEDKLAEHKRVTGIKADEVMMLPSNVLQGLVRGMADLSKAVISGTFSVGKELRKSVEDTFKKEPKAEPK